MNAPADTDFEAINRVAIGRLEDLLRSFLPGGRRENHEYIARNPRRQDKTLGSFSINLNDGVWKDFASGDGGSDPVSLWQYIFNTPNMHDAARILAGHVGAPELAGANDNQKAAPAGKQAWTPILPVPADAGAPPDEKWTLDEETNGWVKHPIVARWAYRDAAGKLLGYAARVQLPDGAKDVVPQTYCRGEDGSCKWKIKSFPKPRPLYGLDRLAAKPDASVVIFEGEKTADAGHQLLQRPASVTWPGGSNAIEYVDLAPLVGRAVAIWPDNDQPGFIAAVRLARRLAGIASKIRIVLPPEWAGEGWDVADPAPDGWDAVAHLRAAALELDPFCEAVGLFQPPPVDAAAPVLEVPSTGDDERTSYDLTNVDWYRPFPDINPKGAPLATIENLAEAINRLGVVVRYNVISKEIEILIPNEGFTVDNSANASLAWLMSACVRFGMPTDKLGDFLCYLADRNLFNPVANWISSKPWDGVTRLPDLIATIKAEGEDDEPEAYRLKSTMITRWMISAVAAAFRPNGVSAHGVLVLQGDQYLGKTAWFKSLAPSSLGVIQDGLSLRPDDRDSVKQAVGYWLVELGELDATFRKADISALKAFITRDKDVLRRAYARLESKFARRTIFFASVNPRQFLHDSTGNRRYWTISCEAINHDHGLDMQQVWAEVYALYLAGESWYLTADEMALLNGHNRDFEVLDPIRERLESFYDWQSDKYNWRWITATEVMSEIGFDRPSRADVTLCGQYLIEMNGRERKRIRGRNLSLVPPRKIAQYHND